MRKIPAVACLMLAGALCPCAVALDPALEINQYAHKAWIVRESFFKGSIYAIAQTPDGYLWIGTDFGLERFDGVRSVPWKPSQEEHLPGGRVRSLLADRDGRLWIGTDEGLASLKDGKVSHYPELAGKTVLSILEDREGIIWVAGWGVGSTDGRLCTIRDGGVRCYGDDGRLGNGIDGLYEDRDRQLWAGTVDGVWRWKPEPAKFFPMPIVTSSFAEGDDGELFITTLDGIRSLVNEQPGPYLVRAGGQQSRFGKILRDGDGGLWVGTYDGGLLHLHHGKTDRFTHSDGLSGDNIRCLFEDREGNIWVGTRDGLDRFREFAVPAITEKQGLSNSYVGSILYAREGSMWLGTLNGLDRWKDGQVTVYGTQHGLPDPVAQSLFEDQAGRIWVSTRRGLVYLERGRFIPVPGPSGSVVCIVGDNAGGIWISDQMSLYHVDGGRVVEAIPWTKLGHKDYAWTLLPDPKRGGLWLGFRQGGVAYYKDHSLRLSYGREQGFSEGQVTGLKLDNDGSIWAATAGGLNLIRNGRTFRLSAANGFPCETVLWVQEDSDHFFWFYTACGLVRLARVEVDRWVANPKNTVNTMVLDNLDGVRSSVAPTDSNPMVAQSADGKIWFLPKDGVSIVDPRRLVFNKLPPPVHIEQVTADDKPYPAASGMRLPRRVHYLAIAYTALSLVAPEKLRFRYKLDGVDPGWREVINERKVEYSRLRPGHYRFHVVACNNSGVWNEQGDSFDFYLPPAWYQTSWFYAACVAAFLALLWAAYQFRMGQLAYQFNLRLEERVGERTRIARDLHDTLLQSFQGLLPLFQVALHKLPEGAFDARTTLQSAIDRAANAITEGRDAVQGLRISTVEKNDLAMAIEAVGEELALTDANQPAPRFNVVVEGASRDLHPILRDEIYRIAAEALRNAFRHAEAQSVEVEIRYDPKYFCLRIRDSGKGIADGVLCGEGREGHYGLPGMRERARLVGGKLTIRSEVGSGTEIELLIPASKVYAKSPRRFWQFGKRAQRNTAIKKAVE